VEVKKKSAPALFFFLSIKYQRDFADNYNIIQILIRHFDENIVRKTINIAGKAEKTANI